MAAVLLTATAAYEKENVMTVTAKTPVVIEDEDVPLAGGTKVYVPKASGEKVYSSGAAKIDVSNASEGYIVANYSGGASKVKLQITGGDLDAVTFSFDGLDGVRLPLIGSYQPRNAALAITALRVLRQQGWNIPESAIRTGLEQVSWPGRFELLRHSPAFVLDGSHNAHGMRATVQSLKDRFPGQKFVFLVSIMADKDVDEMLALLAPLAERFVTVTAHNPRAMPAQTLAEHIRAYGCTAEAADSIEAGVARAEELGGEGPVCALGTLYFSGDVRQAFARLNA